MSSFYDDASLVVIPSGYKTSKIYAEKPTDGSGDLTFTRASDATRVGPDGLIEKVRTNVLTYSQTFSDASWLIGTGQTKTQSQTDPNGGTTAVLISNVSEANGYLSKALVLTANVPNTFSIYIKGAASGSVSIRLDDSTAGPQFDINYTTSWQRFSVTRTVDQSSCFLTVGGYSTWAIGENIQFAFAQVETGDIATDYIPTTTAAVSVGPVSNVPRLDYLGSTCPRLNLEPQRTNVVTYSEQMDNASWIKLNGAVTANTAVSPDGYTNADKFVPNTTSGVHALRSNLFNQSATAAHSWFVKADGYSKIAVRESELVGNYASFNLSTGALISTNATGSIVNYGNGWYRCTLVDTTIGLLAQTSIVVLPDSYTTGDPLVNWSGDGTKGVLAYGAMVEIGAYATSYIPSLNSATTRVADAASKTGISSLIGQTEGTLFVEAKITLDGRLLLIGQSFDIIEILTTTAGKVNVFVYNGSVQADIFSSATYATGDRLKIGFAYKQNDFVLYINGTPQGSDTSGNTPTGMAQLILNDFYTPGLNSANAYSQSLLFTTRLTNAQLAELTTL
jgi:hypothetical protein